MCLSSTASACEHPPPRCIARSGRASPRLARACPSCSSSLFVPAHREEGRDRHPFNEDRHAAVVVVTCHVDTAVKSTDTVRWPAGTFLAPPPQKLPPGWNSVVEYIIAHRGTRKYQTERTLPLSHTFLLSTSPASNTPNSLMCLSPSREHRRKHICQ